MFDQGDVKIRLFLNDRTERQKISLANIKSNEYMKLLVGKCQIHSLIMILQRDILIQILFLNTF